MPKAQDLFDFASQKAMDVTVGRKTIAENNGTKSSLVGARKKKVKAAASSNVGREYTAGDIEVLEGLEPVRRRPGMYVGGTDSHALHHLLAEVLDNSMDEAIAGYASRIELSLHLDGSASVSDNGRGIPVDRHPKFKNKSARDILQILCF